ncbi:phage regulatory protein, rha family [Gracilibacillus orientalis]|uniref:Phage regulatory protein, rha family n=1 Tax=Gracilibacillus orientalis TaxID=334253 RepID=A0A1I4PLY1_9BACI|nr:Rha family transcriptional regulator [Gracilibacillus orientalis]SFM28626.1 phage regulatory protein, rha family [Gracilibacillus orientalis]
MQQLVFIQNEQIVTDSLTIAETFQKEHARVMRDIRELECSQEFRVGNFAESSYINTQGRSYPKFILTEQAFTLLVMGYTGSQAQHFKEKYIAEFHKMREQLQNNVKVLDDRTAFIQSLKMTVETAERQDQLQKVVNDQQLKLSTLKSKMDEQITLDHGEQRRFQKGVAHRVYQFTGDRSEASRLFRELYREIKDRFGVSSYKDVKRKDLQTALNYIENWVPRKVS